MGTPANFTKLLEPTQIGKMTIRNRVVFPPMGTNYASDEGYVNERIKAYYEERARGGCGLVIVECTGVDLLGRTLLRQVRIDDDKYIPGLRELARAIKRHGARAAIQLQHAGRVSRFIPPPLKPLAPSAIPAVGGYAMPKEATREEIKALVTQFGQAAERAKKAGFDGIEIHGAHGYIFAQFLSLDSNHRQDEYGGSLENRARFLIETIRACREAVGSDYPLWVRINGKEYDKVNGTTVAEAQETARMAQAAGVDAIHVSGYQMSQRRYYPLAEPVGNIVHLAQAIKEVVTVPVIAVGRITAEVGEKILSQNKADLVAIGRGQIAEPHLVKKVASGKVKDIAPCIQCLYCNETISDFHTYDGFMQCSVNAMAGHEFEYQIKKAEKAKKVIVVGGGPAGMEAARVARLRGHKVTLYEKSPRLGGLLQAAVVPPYKYGIRTLMDYLQSQMGRLRVRLELGKEVTPELVMQARPDAVICATGSEPVLPNVAGITRNNVVFAIDVLLNRVDSGDKIVVIGGGLVGCETAHYLASLGRSVTVVEMLDHVGADVGAEGKRSLESRLSESNRITVLTGARCEELNSHGLSVRDGSGVTRNLEADTIVVATGARASADLFNALQGTGIEVYNAGDSVKPRRLLEAIEDGSRVGRQV